MSERHIYALAISVWAMLALNILISGVNFYRLSNLDDHLGKSQTEVVTQILTVISGMESHYRSTGTVKGAK